LYVYTVVRIIATVLSFLLWCVDHQLQLPNCHEWRKNVWRPKKVDNNGHCSSIKTAITIAGAGIARQGAPNTPIDLSWLFPSL